MALQIYSRGDENVLPINNDTDLENAFTVLEYDQVSADDAVRVTQVAHCEQPFSVFLFKIQNASQEIINVFWNGQSDRAPSISPIYLQIFNRNTTLWETLDSNNTAAANIDFDLIAQVVSNLGDYYDVGFWVSIRTYQEVL